VQTHGAKLAVVVSGAAEPDLWFSADGKIPCFIQHILCIYR